MDVVFPPRSKSLSNVGGTMSQGRALGDTGHFSICTKGGKEEGVEGRFYDGVCKAPI